MKNIHNPHDKLFKETFSDLEVVHDFVTHYVPNEIANLIAVDSLKPQKDSFIQPKLDEYYSDLLFEASFDGRDGYLYILFEHKSYPDSYVSLQLLRYMLEIWETKVDKEKEKALPIILPIVFYQGKKKWGKPRTINELIGDEKGAFPELCQYVPNFEMLFYNFSPYGKIGIKGSTKLRSYLQVIKHVYGEDQEQIYSAIIQLDRAGETDYFITIFIYLIHVIDSFSIDRLKERLTVEGRKKVMTIAEQWLREGEKKGIRIGEEKGEAKGVYKEKISIAKRMIHLDKTDEEIMELTDLTKEEIDGLRK